MQNLLTHITLKKKIYREIVQSNLWDDIWLIPYKM